MGLAVPILEADVHRGASTSPKSAGSAGNIRSKYGAYIVFKINSISLTGIEKSNIGPKSAAIIGFIGKIWRDRHNYDACTQIHVYIAKL
ncbi:hypothetical protein [Sphingobium sp.]|uniref:hypothetical protein n=1 Tax=Sphingobium sp. TaxID=1912891 RepID=UPI00261FD6D4|nr:hypothetical protein [Sphingobium sp.]